MTTRWVAEAASLDDAKEVYKLIQSFAADLGGADAVKISLKEFIDDGFSKESLFKVLSVKNEVADLVGYCVYYIAYSTWDGKVLHLEDLYIKPGFRGLGIGSAIMQALAKLSVETKIRRVAWVVPRDRVQSQHFYLKCGAKVCDEWLTMQLKEPQLSQLANL